MKKVMQPKKSIRLTEAEKKIIAQYSASNEVNIIKPLHSVISDKRTVK